MTRRNRKGVFACDCGDHVWTPLGRGHVALASPEDRPLLESRTWCLNSWGYAHSGTRGKWQTMHGLIFGARGPDHRKGWKTDNRRHMLRDATPSQQQMNKRQRNRTGFRGVARNSRKYSATIQVGRRHTYLGNFDTPEAAAMAYDEASRRLHGPYGIRNFEEAK